MTTFRQDTSFPFLKIAREAGVPYGRVLHIAEAIEDGAVPFGLAVTDPLVSKIIGTVAAEAARRDAVAA